MCDLCLLPFLHVRCHLDTLWTLPILAQFDGCRGCSAGGGHGGIVDTAVLVCILPHGVWWSSALRTSVPGDPQDEQHWGFLHQSLSGPAHSQHLTHLLLVSGDRYWKYVVCIFMNLSESIMCNWRQRLLTWSFIGSVGGDRWRWNNGS